MYAQERQTKKPMLLPEQLLLFVCGNTAYLTEYLTRQRAKRTPVV